MNVIRFTMAQSFQKMNYMPKKGKPSKPSSADLFRVLSERAGRRKKKSRGLLEQLGVKEFFAEGNIAIDKRTCRGVDCKLCIKACPTNALYWRAGEVGIIDELCIYCGACVVSCIVDDCIRISRKRLTGEVESFSKPKEFTTLQHGINVKKRRGKIQEAFPKTEDYLKEYREKKK